MKITRMHGAGGKVMQELIKDVILKNLEITSVNGGIGLESLDDSATIPIGDKEIVLLLMDTQLNQYSSQVEILEDWLLVEL